MLFNIFFLKAKTRNFITSQVDREGHEPPKKLQTLGGDQPKHRIDPGPITNHNTANSCAQTLQERGT